jgi:hypothetical protein
VKITFHGARVSNEVTKIWSEILGCTILRVQFSRKLG